jgi:hypothetical protein
MRVRKACMIVVALWGVLAGPVLADTRTSTIDVIIALDKSLSMETKIGAVEAWVNSSIIDQLLIPGDFLVIVDFYGKAEVIISQQVKDDADKLALKKVISRIKGNGSFTDIGNALDAVKAEVAKLETDKREKYILLLTDGIQEAPPTSKYYSKNGQFNHEFLANTKTIQEKGWKVMILGIGTDTAARDLAKELQGSYNEITNVGTLNAQSGSLFASVEVKGGFMPSPIKADGSSSVAFTLSSSGLNADTKITVNAVEARLGMTPAPQILRQPYSFTVKKVGSTPVSIPLAFPSVPQPGNLSGTIFFTFGPGQSFSPAEPAVSFTLASWIQNNLMLIIGACLLFLLVIAAIVYLVWRLSAGKPVRFSVLIGDAPVTEEPVSLRGRRELFLTEASHAFVLAPKRTGRSLARFSLKNGKVLLSLLKKDRFPKLTDIPPDARGKSFALRSEDGKTLTMKVQSKERKK